MELTQALSSRHEGNEGRARVCARRAAGIAVGEFLYRQGFLKIPNSAYDRLIFLYNISGENPAIISLISHLLMEVSVEHTLPASIDLIADVQRLLQILNLDLTS